MMGDKVKPKFQTSVTLDLWEAVMSVTSAGFADSYLYGAMVMDGTLEPRTLIAYDILLRDKGVRNVLNHFGLVLRKPEPWRDGNGKLTASECYGMLGESPFKKKRRNYDPSV